MQESGNIEPPSPVMSLSNIGTPWSKNPLSKINPMEWKSYLIEDSCASNTKFQEIQRLIEDLNKRNKHKTTRLEKEMFKQKETLSTKMSNLESDFHKTFSSTRIEIDSMISKQKNATDKIEVDIAETIREFNDKMKKIDNIIAIKKWVEDRLAEGLVQFDAKIEERESNLISKVGISITELQEKIVNEKEETYEYIEEIQNSINTTLKDQKGLFDKHKKTTHDNQINSNKRFSEVKSQIEQLSSLLKESQVALESKISSITFAPVYTSIENLDKTLSSQIKNLKIEFESKPEYAIQSSVDEKLKILEEKIEEEIEELRRESLLKLDQIVLPSQESTNFQPNSVQSPLDSSLLLQNPSNPISNPLPPSPKLPPPSLNEPSPSPTTKPPDQQPQSHSPPTHPPPDPLPPTTPPPTPPPIPAPSFIPPPVILQPPPVILTPSIDLSAVEKKIKEFCKTKIKLLSAKQQADSDKLSLDLQQLPQLAARVEEIHQLFEELRDSAGQSELNTQAVGKRVESVESEILNLKDTICMIENNRATVPVVYDRNDNAPQNRSFQEFKEMLAHKKVIKKMKTKAFGMSGNITDSYVNDKLPLIKKHKNSRSNVASPLNMRMNQNNTENDFTSRNINEIRSQTIAPDSKQEFTHMILNSFSIPNPSINKMQKPENKFSGYVKNNPKLPKSKSKRQKDINTQTMNMPDIDSDSDMNEAKHSPSKVSYEPIPGLNVFK